MYKVKTGMADVTYSYNLINLIKTKHARAGVYVMHEYIIMTQKSFSLLLLLQYRREIILGLV